MPYFYYKCECGSESLTAALNRYLSLSGVNLREGFTARADAVGLVLSRGMPSVRFRPAAARFARCLSSCLRCACPNTVLRQERLLCSFPVPTAFVSIPEALDDDACARLISNAVQRYFLLPALPDRPEMPARIGARAACLYTVADSSSRILQVLDADRCVTCLGTSGTWCVIRAAEELGFCRSEDLRLY